MPERAQFTRDIICGLIIIIFTGIFYLSITHYLRGLQNPFLLVIAFSISLIISCFFEIRYDRNREGFVSVAVNTILFTAGVIVAEHFRLYYIHLLASVDEISGAAELIGEEYLSVASSKVVGYGGAYGFGLVITRLIGRSSMLNALTEYLILPIYRSDTCQHCRQSIASP